MCDVCRRALNPQGKNRLELHRKDHAEVETPPFEHFFCPILFEDTPTELSRGHVITDALKGSPKAWVVQRKDVDSFYGGFFEGDFQLFQFFTKTTVWDDFFDKVLFREAKPVISYGGKTIRYFPWHSKNNDDLPPQGCTVINLEHKDRAISLCVHEQDPNVLAHVNEWQISRTKDLRLAAFVSLLRTAHLSMFSMLGYRYALSNAGKFIGGDLLGNFYRQARHLRTKAKVQKAALDFFRPYRNMIHYTVPGITALAGTLNDGYVNLCASSTSTPWGMIVYVKIQEFLSAVLLPVADDPNAFAKYQDFLQNDHEKIHVIVCRFDAENARWNATPERHEATWLKRLDSYPSA